MAAPRVAVPENCFGLALAGLIIRRASNRILPHNGKKTQSTDRWAVFFCSGRYAMEPHAVVSPASFAIAAWSVSAQMSVCSPFRLFFRKTKRIRARRMILEPMLPSTPKLTL